MIYPYYSFETGKDTIDFLFTFNSVWSCPKQNKEVVLECFLNLVKNKDKIHA